MDSKLHLLKSGCKVYAGKESWVNWWVYTSNAGNPGLVREHPSYYGGPGEIFAKGICIRRVGKRVLVTQHCGLDV